MKRIDPSQLPCLQRHFVLQGHPTAIHPGNIASVTLLTLKGPLPPTTSLRHATKYLVSNDSATPKTQQADLASNLALAILDCATVPPSPAAPSHHIIRLLSRNPAKARDPALASSLLSAITDCVIKAARPR